jgi:hypothetical protein
VQSLLAVAGNGKVIDGRYRLRAAQEIGLKTLPVLIIDIDSNDDSVVSWIFHSKIDREHLAEGHFFLQSKASPGSSSARVM